MLHVVYGNDVDARTQALQKILAEYAHIPTEAYDDTTFSPEHFMNTVHGFGLFEEAKVFIFKNILSSDLYEDQVIKFLRDMADSSHLFIFSDRELGTAMLKTVKKHTASCAECTLSKSKKEEYNIFTITNYLERFDKKNMWLELHKALENQNSFESITGILLWKLKSMMTGSRKFSKDQKELQNMYLSLIDVYHQSRLGADSFSLLESWVLERV